MAERNSEYERQPADDYATPGWVTRALLAAYPFPRTIWEPAPGRGDMVQTLVAFGHNVIAGDGDFLKSQTTTARAIITNPPYNLADQFVRHAIELMRPVNGSVAMLLPLAWSTAKSRRDIFADSPIFRQKLELTRRIRWANLEQKASGPSQNHAWYVWDWGPVNGTAEIGWLAGGEA